MAPSSRPPAAARETPHTLVLENVNPTTRLLEKRRQMFEVQDRLDEQKAEFRAEEERFKDREETLKRKDLDLQESLIRFSKFLQENDGKRTSAQRKAQDEIKIRTQKEAEIDRLATELDGLRTRSETTERRRRTPVAIRDVPRERRRPRRGVPGDKRRDAATRHVGGDEQRSDGGERGVRRGGGEMQGGDGERRQRETGRDLNLNNEIARLKKDLERAEREAAETETRAGRDAADVGADDDGAWTGVHGDG